MMMSGAHIIVLVLLLSTLMKQQHPLAGAHQKAQRSSVTCRHTESNTRHPAGPDASAHPPERACRREDIAPEGPG